MTRLPKLGSFPLPLLILFSLARLSVGVMRVEAQQTPGGGGAGGVLYVSTAPSGSCAAGAKIEKLVTGGGATYTCQSISGGTGTWGTLSSSSATGTVTSVGLSVNATNVSGIFAVTGSPVSTSGTLNINLTGTSGGVPYFSTSSVLSSSGALPAGDFVLGGGAGNPPTATFSIVPAANGGLGIATNSSTGVPSVASGVWTIGATLAANLGGTGLDTSASTGVPQIASGTWSVSTTLPSGLSATNLTLVTPALGTPASGTMTNVTGLPLTTGVTGILPVANGGSGTGSTLTGLVRGGSPFTASELSGHATTSGSNVVSVVGLDFGSTPFTLSTSTPPSASLPCVGYLNSTTLGGIVCGSGALSGMTAGQVAIAGSSTTVTSSEALAGSGAAITTGPASGVTSGDLAEFTGTTGQIADSGALLSTFSHCPASTAGSLCVWNGSSWNVFAGNASGTGVFQEDSSGSPTWNTSTASSIFTSYQFGTQTALTGSGLYLQTTYPSFFSLAQSGAGTSGSPYVDAISLASQSANTLFGNFTNGSAAPGFQTQSGCSGNNDASIYTLGTGLGCNTHVAQLNLAQTFTATQTLQNVVPSADATYALDTSSVRWTNLWLSGLTQYDTMVVGASGQLSQVANGITGSVLTATNSAAPTYAVPAITSNPTVTSANYTLQCDSGTTTIDRSHTIPFATGASTPSLPSSAASGCSGLAAVVEDQNVSSLVFSRTGSDTFQVYNGSAFAGTQTSFTLNPGQWASVNQNASLSWEVRISPVPGSFSGTLAEPVIGTGTNVTSSPLFLDVSQISGATGDAILNGATAYLITAGGGTGDTRAIPTESLTSLTQLTDPLAPPAVAATGTSPCSSGTCQAKIVYTYSSVGCGGECTQNASQETLVSSVSTSQKITVTAPTYTGSATGWNVYMAIASGSAPTSWTETKCNTTALTLGVNYDITAACSGAAVNLKNYNLAWILPVDGAWTCTMTAGTSDCIDIGNHTDIEGSVTGSSSIFKIQAASTTNVANSGVSGVPGALFATSPNPKLGVGSIYIRLIGLSAWDQQTSAVVPSSLRIANTSDSSVLRDVSAINAYQSSNSGGPYGDGGCGIWAFAVGYADWQNIHVDGNNSTGEYGFCLGASGAGQTVLNIDNLVSVHTSGPNLYYYGGQNDLNIQSLTEEGETAVSGCSNVMNDFAAGTTQNGAVHIGTFKIGANCTSSTATAIKLESNAYQIDIDRISIGGATGMTCITNNVSGYPTTPLTQSQCDSVATGPAGGYHFSRTAPIFAGGLQINNGLTLSGSLTTGLTTAGLVTTTSGGVIGSEANATIAQGGTNATSAAAGTVPNASSGTASSWTPTGTMGVPGTTAGSWTLANGAAAFSTTYGSAATANNTFLGFAAAPTNNNAVYASVSGTSTILVGTGYAYNAIPFADLTISSANILGVCTTCVTSAASLTSTALMTGAGSQGSQTPSATSTLSSAGVLQLAAGGSIGSADTGTPKFTFSSYKMTATGDIVAAASAAGATGYASLNIPSGSAPTTNLTSGDVWNLSGILQFYDGSHTNSLTTIQAAPTSGNLAAFSGTAGLLAAATTANLGTLLDAAQYSLWYSGGTSAAPVAITPVASAVLVTNGSDVPSESTTLPSGLTIPVGDIPAAIPIGSVGSSGLSGAGPMAIASTGAISITGAAGEVLAGATPAFTATPALGTDNSVAGTLQISNGSASAHATIQTSAPATDTFDTEKQKTRTACATDIAPATGDDTLIVLLNAANAVHLTRFSCGVTGTTSVVANIDTGGTTALLSDQTCTAGNVNTVTTSTFISSPCGGTSSCALTAHTPVTIHIGTISGTPTSLAACVDYTVD
jgi:hypothetical protein